MKKYRFKIIVSHKIATVLIYGSINLGELYNSRHEITFHIVIWTDYTFK